MRVNSDQVGGCYKWYTPRLSTRSPTICALYKRPFQKAKTSEIFLFADDMKMFKAIYSKDDCKLLQDDINCTYSWTDSSLLVFHPAKCKRMRIGTSRIDDFTCTMGPQQVILEKSVAEKDVGVIIDLNLSYKAHMTEKN